MNAAQTAALNAFLATLSATQRSTFMDIVASRTEDDRIAVDSEQMDEADPFVEALNTTATLSIAA
jgi:hypothetical protein